MKGHRTVSWPLLVLPVCVGPASCVLNPLYLIPCCCRWLELEFDLSGVGESNCRILGANLSILGANLSLITNNYVKLVWTVALYFSAIRSTPFSFYKNTEAEILRIFLE